MSETSISRSDTVIEEEANNQQSSTNVLTSNNKSISSITPQKIINNLEQLVINTSTEKSYSKIAACGITKTKKTLEALLSRHGGQANCIMNENEAFINNKNYTLDVNGRVCLVKNSDNKTNRTQEVLALKKDTEELKSLQKHLFVALESLMHEHRKTMLEFISESKNKPKRVKTDDIQNIVKITNDKLISDFGGIIKTLDEKFAKEALRSDCRKKIIEYIELETFLMRELLNVEDIREASVGDLVKKWRIRRKNKSS